MIGEKDGKGLERRTEKIIGKKDREKDWLDRLEKGLQVVEFSYTIAVPSPYCIDYCFGLLQLFKNSKPWKFIKSIEILYINHKNIIFFAVLIIVIVISSTRF